MKAVSAIGAALMLGGCALMPATRTEQSAAEATPTPIPTAQIALKPTYRVQQGEVIDTTTFSGRVSPQKEEALYFRTDGRIRTVFFKRNELVKQGDVIAEFEIDALERELTAADLELERAQVTLDEAMRNLELDQREAQTRLERAQIMLDGADRDPNVSRAGVEAYQKDVDLAQIEVDRLGVGVSPLLQNDLTRARYAVEKLKQEIAEAQIIAPFDGILLSLSLTPGQAVTGYQPVASVADDSAMEISADLLSNQLQLLAEAMPVTFVLSSRPGDTLHGVIRRLPYPYGSGGSGQTIEAKDKSTRITIDESAQTGNYAIGDLVRVTAEVERAADVLWLPPQAIRNFNGRLFVVVQDGDVQRRVDVRIGVEAEDRVEILEGVEEDQVVVGP
ncbi:HlyD family efflux transporter periplasmic adaptor subunit [Caldilinea sp.]|uniref:efflux RND transporter periplasmic adaptor subunit n=1 Tax=Caldilinea sp. TaxID=2293560 RepID=UPI002CECA9DA|nr:efflux RND transporter periplasmic adaptor subunit [Caldilinea sp.]HRA68995.1 efflux RND transporter periplasmic adaptor subunit [Caldilinea sp.]